MTDADYRIEVRRPAERAIHRVPRPDQMRIYQKIKALATDPRPAGCAVLQNAPGYRIRVGDYRVIYEVRDTERLIVIRAAGHRKDIYRDL